MTGELETAFLPKLLLHEVFLSQQIETLKQAVKVKQEDSNGSTRENWSREDGISPLVLFGVREDEKSVEN